MDCICCASSSQLNSTAAASAALPQEQSQRTVAKNTPSVRTARVPRVAPSLSSYIACTLLCSDQIHQFDIGSNE